MVETGGRSRKKNEMWNLERERLISFIYNTNAIEGNTLTLEETAAIINGKTNIRKKRTH
jgi:Fic family protein